MAMQYIIFVIDTPENPATPSEMSAIDAFNAKLQSRGSWITAAGIRGFSGTYVIDSRATSELVRSGSFVEGSENYTGFWIIECGSDDHALELAKEASKACNRRVELRPYLH